MGTKEEGEGKGEEEEDGGATQEEHPPEEEDEEDEMMEEASLSSSKAGRMVEVPDMQVCTWGQMWRLVVNLIWYCAMTHPTTDD